MSSAPEAHINERVLLSRGDAIRELAAHVHAAEARLATMVAEFIADGTWNNSGDWRSVGHWLVLNCGFTTAEASKFERVARAAEAMPTVMAHAHRGEVSLGVAALAARVATPEVDEALATIVTTVAPPQASRLISTYRRLDDLRREQADEPVDQPADTAPAPTPADDEFDDRSRWYSWHDETGRWHARAEASPEIGALLDEAYAAAHRSVERDLPADDPSSRVQADDVLRAWADSMLDGARARRLQREGGGHFAVNVLIDLATLVSGELRADSVCRLQSGAQIRPELVRRLAEEGTLQLLWHRNGIPLKLGHEVRFASPAQQKALRFRDGGCTVPGCGRRNHLHAHHVEHHPAGPTDLENLVLLCEFHHRRVHQGGWTVVPAGDQRFTFRDGRGDVVGLRLADRDGPPVPLESLPEHQQLEVDRSTATPIGICDRLTDFAANVYMHRLLEAG